MDHFRKLAETIKKLDEQEAERLEREQKKVEKVNLIKNSVHALIEDGRVAPFDISVVETEVNDGFEWAFKIYGRDAIVLSQEVIIATFGKPLYIDYKLVLIDLIDAKLKSTSH
ncbi:hypothetical protein NSS98_21200 [Paenibacillus sp. FSL E2-0274]|uniref:hypothetical protein n=1 Tax=Paenibacillus TaxID=44249 RepID=UPI00096DD3E6|nr:hypothetical protein [Paenibacillus odorifer]OME31789.1 hypothetical protein BSK63_14665 [Paenibacillus odorifer]